MPPVSILKPLKGTDPDIYESFRSHCLQDYPEYEIIFGVSDPDDPAVASVQQLQREFPERSIRLVVCPNKLGANVKVSNLEQMLSAARYQHLLVNDSDIRVEPDYLRRIMAPLTDERVGMVTCLYRGVPAATLGSRLESLGISTDFCAGVLVARQLEGGLRFGLGSTLAFRRADLERIGGFKSIVDFLADDYELGRRIAGLGLQVVLSDVVVETHLPAYDLRGFLSHQLRWARGVRDSRAGGYIGLVSTYGLMWGLFALIAGRARALVVGRARRDRSVARGGSTRGGQCCARRSTACWEACGFCRFVIWWQSRLDCELRGPYGDLARRSIRIEEGPADSIVVSAVAKAGRRRYGEFGLSSGAILPPLPKRYFSPRQ